MRDRVRLDDLFRGVVTVALVAACSGAGAGPQPASTIFAWGNGAAGQLGNGQSGNSSVPVAVGAVAGITAMAGRRRARTSSRGAG